MQPPSEEPPLFRSFSRREPERSRGRQPLSLFVLLDHLIGKERRHRLPVALKEFKLAQERGRDIFFNLPCSIAGAKTTALITEQLIARAKDTSLLLIREVAPALCEVWSEREFSEDQRAPHELDGR